MSFDGDFYQAVSRALKDGDDDPLAALLGNKGAGRIEAHRGNYQMSAAGAIISGYPVVKRLVGKEYMLALAMAYVQKHPPKIASLTLYGNGFAEFLRSFAPIQDELSYLPAIAELDAAWFAAYGAAQAAPLSANDLRDQPPAFLPMLTPGLQASAQLLRFKIPAYSIWKTNKDDETPRATKMQSKTEWALIWRMNNEIHHTGLSQSEYVFLNNVEAKQSLAQSYAEARRYFTEFDLQQQFSRWLSAGVFKGEANDQID